MPRIPRPLLVSFLLSVVFLGACCHPSAQAPKALGDPEFPYPLASPPKIGQIVHLPTGTLVSFEQMADVAADSRVVYLGETHDNPASHRLELQLLKALAERHPGQQALAMEMFTRSQQPVLDRWVAGELSEKAFLKESRWYETWKSDFAYYRDILLYAREKHIPVIALNAEKEQVAALRTRSPEELSPEQRKALPEMDFSDPYQRALVEAIFADHLKGGLKVDGFLRAQTLWDETMAESVANYLKSPQGSNRKLVVMAGGHHVSYGFGIPRRVFRRVPTSYVLVGGHEINLGEQKQDRLMDVEIPQFPMVPYHFLAYLSYEDLPKGVRLGVGVEPAKGEKGLLVNMVEPKSAADDAGVHQGDILLELDGEPLLETLDLVFAVKKKNPGDPGRLKLKRGGEILDLGVRFGAPTPPEHPK